jgi:hypothetical protein
MPRMRARHEVFGVKDVPDTAHYRESGWEPVDPSTPTTAEERRNAVNDARRGIFDPAEHKAAEVVEALEALPEPERATVVAAEKSGKARKTVVEADQD